MSKYDPLYKFLCAQGAKKIHKVSMTFEQIEVVILSLLPDTARRRAQWWANEGGPSRHIQSHAWINAGYETRSLNLPKEIVEFVRVN